MSDKFDHSQVPRHRQLDKARLPIYARWLVLGIVLLTIVMRLPALASRSLWYDEAFSILFARRGLRAMLYGTVTPVSGGAADIHPLLYYTILWVWMKLFGQGIVAVRCLSVLLSVGLLMALMRLARALFSQPIALLTGLLFALAPFQIHYGQEARMYILLSLLLVLATHALWNSITQQSRRSLIFFALFSALAMYSHVLAIFYLVPLAVVLLVQFPSKDTFWKILGGTILSLLLYSPWLVQLPGQVSKVQQSYWIDRPGAGALLQTMIGFVVDLPVSADLLPIMLGISLTLFAFVWIESIRLFRRQSEGRKAGIFALGLSWFPVLLLFVLSQWRPLYILRGLLPSGGMYLLSIAWVMNQGRKPSRWILSLCLLGGFIAGNIAHYAYSGFPYAPFTALNANIHADPETNVTVLHSNKLTMLPAYLDDPSLPHTYLQDPPGSGSDTLAYPTQEVLGLIAESDPLEAAADAQKVYFIVFKQEFEDYERIGLTEHPGLAALEKQYLETNQMAWGDLRVYTLERQR